MKYKMLPILALASAIPATALADSPLVTEPPDPSEVIGGQDCEACAWPTTVAVQGGTSLCTGTLIHPQVVMYAAHCGSEAEKIRFGEKVSPPSKVQTVDFCMTNPSYGGTQDQAHDWAFCKLAAPVPMAVTPVIYGCETSVLTAGRQVAIVGFGNNSTDDTGAGTKRWAMSQINVVYNGVLDIGGGGTGICNGDSGGPAFVQFPDGSWHNIGITSTGTGCGNSGQFSRAENALPWIEEQSGIDVTPCHDIDGTWNPTPQCQKFFAGGGQGYGAWSYWCDETPVSGSSDTCGDPFDAIPDNDAPNVTITSPQDGDSWDSPPTFDIEIDADDGSGWGVMQVELEINGELQAIVDSEPPWQFSGVTFPEGQYVLVAVATDWAENVGRSDGVGIGVGQDAPDPGDDGGTGDDGGDDGGTGTGGDDGGDDGGDGSGDGGDDGYPPGTVPNNRDGDDGCGCTAGPTPLSSALMLLALGFVRRRK